MYESFFGFVKRPFLAVSTLDRYFPATSIEQTLQTASRAIQRGEGPVAIFGGTGLGKTMCCLRIAENFRRSFEVVMLASSQLITRRALLQSLLFELRMPYREMSEGELRLTLMNRLQPSTENPSDGLVLIVDEAQSLSVKLLEELRLLTNIVRNGIPRVRLILCGTMRLEESLSNPQMESLSQRLAARCYLTPLTPQETGQYVKHKMELCGAESSSVMTRDALDAIYRGSDGIPRLIDQLADQALMLACSERERPVSSAMIGKAWCMLQQLPNPWSEPESLPKSSRSSPANPAASTNSVEAVGNLPREFKITVQAPPVDKIIPTKLSTTTQTQSSPIAVSQGSVTQKSVTQKSVAQVPVMQTPSMQPLELHSQVTLQPVFSDLASNSVHIALPPSVSTPISMPAVTTSSSMAPTRVKESSTSNIEFGSLDDELMLAPESSTRAEEIKKKNLLDVFAGDFDEEFSIPVQSSGSYQAYSGIAYGNLNYDLSSFGTSGAPANLKNSIEIEESNECPPWLKPVSSQPESRPMPSAIESQYYDTISNISPEQAANLERQIEEEMRELVSGLNLSAMTFDPASKIDMFSSASEYKFEAVEDIDTTSGHRISHGPHSEVLSFTGLAKEDMFTSAQGYASPADDEVPSMNDDRDILIIENELESMRTGTRQSPSKTSRAVMHPYAKLFSKLRNG